jgi:septum formation protein
LQQYGVYQVEGKGKQLFSSIKGDLNSILGMPIQPIVHYFTHQAK